MSELKYMANYFEDVYNTDNLIDKVKNFVSYHLIAKGGHLIITDTEIYFKPHALNLGVSSPYRRAMKIKSIVDFDKGILPTILVISSETGHRMKLSVWKRDRIIDDIKERMEN